MNGMDAVIQILNGVVKGISIYADKSRGCAERLPLRASPDAFHSTLKIRKSEVVPVNQGFLCGANLCAAARQRPNCTAARRFPLVPANAGTQSGFPRAREMSERNAMGVIKAGRTPIYVAMIRRNLRKTALCGFYWRWGGLLPPRGEGHLPGSE
jgi:hypothetical protein